MTPLDDELRSALSTRAATLTPSPDPLAGIEARASRLRRRRVAASVAGAALAVAAVAVAVPAVLPGPNRAAVPGDGPSATEAADAVAPPANALATPEDLRGQEVAPGEDKVADAWAAAHPGTGAVHRLSLAVGGSGALRYEVLELWRAGGPAYAVVAQDVDTAPVLVRDAVLADDALVIQAVVSAPGDGPLVVGVASREVVVVGYDPGDQEPELPRGLTPGTATTGFSFERTGPRGGADAVVMRLRDERVVREPVWTGSTADRALPSNVLAWQARGDASVSPDVDDLKAAFAKANGDPGLPVEYRPLFVGDTDSGVRYTLGQAWFRGDDRADTVLYAVGGTKGPELSRYGYTPQSASVVVGLVTHLPGTSVDVLVVVPRPGLGQISYDDDAAGDFRPVALGRSDLEGIGFVDRAKDATTDRLEVLDGDGDLDHPLYRGPVATLLTGDPVH